MKETAAGSAAGAVDAENLGGEERFVGVAEEKGRAASAEADLGPGVDEESRVEGGGVGLGADKAHVTGGVGVRDEVQVAAAVGATERVGCPPRW